MEGNKIILNYNFDGTDDFNTFWYQTVRELREYWWDIDFNKLYILVGAGINPSVSMYCINLDNKDVKYYDEIQLWSSENINKQLSYIYYETTTVAGGGMDDFMKTCI